MTKIAKIVINTGRQGLQGNPGIKGDRGDTGDTGYIAIASEAIGSGKNINEWNDSGVMKIRLADNSGLKPSNGFTKEAFVLGDTAMYYKFGVCPVVGASVGSVYLGTNGDFTSTAPIEGSGLILQPLGMAASPTTIYYSKETPVLLAGT